MLLHIHVCAEWNYGGFPLWINTIPNLTTRTLDPQWLQMCNGYSANGTINSCNGDDCVAFLDEHGQSGEILITQPGMWTENEA